jgi:methyl coenzyme M reductase subunit D
MQDMLKLLNLEVEEYEDFGEIPIEIEDKLNQLHRDIEICLQILLCNLKIEEGTYTEVDYGKWRLTEDERRI